MTARVGRRRRSSRGSCWWGPGRARGHARPLCGTTRSRGRGVSHRRRPFVALSPPPRYTGLTAHCSLLDAAFIPLSPPSAAAAAPPTRPAVGVASAQRSSPPHVGPRHLPSPLLKTAHTPCGSPTHVLRSPHHRPNGVCLNLPSTPIPHDVAFGAPRSKRGPSLTGTMTCVRTLAEDTALAVIPVPSLFAHHVMIRHGSLGTLRRELPFHFNFELHIILALPQAVKARIITTPRGRMVRSGV
ncbi:hypothetical protein B0H16DRAFT_1712802 [Mycena metata]|uniref:Uncharacterized protein n=1 Tax=Mycena metata TaxID=1033252 RepID=A0AAD7NUD5_9AGAR|nr:hypothetical protein B0H16DRAFT_1712802 [Mycena metata]